jgi:hypothetical protein
MSSYISLFDKAGSKLLIRELPSIFDGSAREKAQPQDDSKATLAPKVVLVLIMLLRREEKIISLLILLVVQHISDLPLLFPNVTCWTC